MNRTHVIGLGLKPKWRVSHASASPEHEMNPQSALLHSFTSLQPSQKSRFPQLFAWGYLPEKEPDQLNAKSKSSLESALHNSVRKKLKNAIWMGEKKEEEGTLFPNPFPSPKAQTLRWLHMKKGNDESQMFQGNGARRCLLIARIGAAPLQPLCTIRRALVRPREGQYSAVQLLGELCRRHWLNTTTLSYG